jgi:hypothetical protein
MARNVIRRSGGGSIGERRALLSADAQRAARAAAPRVVGGLSLMGHCGCRIAGHGMESEGQFFCCAHCASHRGVTQMQDRAEGQRLA